MRDQVRLTDVTNYLESIAPVNYQEPYDNSGLITGEPKAIVNGILVALDCTEEVVDEAVQSGCNMVVAHHPIIFKGLKKFTGGSYVERAVIKAIKHDVAIYAIHTNLDNVHNGVNKRLCDLIGLKNVKILQPKKDTLSKLVTFVPSDDAEKVISALFRAGAGQIGNYKNCGFTVNGTGTFMPGETAVPHIGEAGKQESVSEVRLELIYPSYLERQIVRTLKEYHPYEEVAYYASGLHNDNQEVGSGMVGELEFAEEPLAFLNGLKLKLDVHVIRATKILEDPVRKVAVCGGSGSFLLGNAIQAGAQVFVTADFKYHDFFDADGKIIVADIGHYESEAHTKELLVDVLMKKFHTFAIIFSKTVTNPISYI